MLTASSTEYWDRFAKGFLTTVGPPLRPPPDHVAVLVEAVRRWTDAHPETAARMLLLGATHEIGVIDWRAGTLLLAVDRSLPMLGCVWPGDLPGRRHAVCADWLALPARDHAYHVVLGDGSLNCVRYPEGVRAVCGSVRRILRPGGIFVLRAYIQPDRQESPETVYDEFHSGAIPSVHHFKFRLLMALQPNARSGIPVADVHADFTRRGIDLQRWKFHPGWEVEALEVLEAYQDTSTIHTFPTLAEFRLVLQEYFEEVAIEWPSTHMGERCPVITLRARP